ncbi:MAG: ATP-binding protein [Desulfobacteraceae bacterium]|nr:ATP-binding protein [Desulfobacteraceae bacterium]
MNSISPAKNNRTPGIFFRVTGDGQILSLNHHGRKCLGLEQVDLTGFNLSSYFPSKKMWRAFLKEIEACGEMTFFDLDFKCPNGQKKFVALSAHLENIEGSICISGHIFDIKNIDQLMTVLKNSRDKFRNILDTIPDLIVELDTGLKIISANKAAAGWLGKDVRDMIGLSCNDLLYAHGRICPKIEGRQCPVDFALKSWQTVNKELKLKNGKGEERWFSLQVYPAFNEDSKSKQVTLFLRDITSQKDAEEEIVILNNELKQTLTDLTKKNAELNDALTVLKETQAHLLQSEKMSSIGQLAAGVAHEINNPVGFVSSNLRTLLSYGKDLTEIIRLYASLEERFSIDQPSSDDIKVLIETIKEQRKAIDLDFIIDDMEDLILQSIDGTERVKKIVADLKDFSHVDQAELKDVDINRCLDSTINIIWNEIKYKAKLKKNYCALPLILGYPQQLNQVFMNILVNAAQSIADKGEIGVTTTITDSPRRGIEIEVKDTGVGMPPEILSKIFDPFFTTKPVGKGTGLGLHVSYKIILKHKGNIKVESTQGIGSTFTIFLPILSEDEFGTEK